VDLLEAGWGWCDSSEFMGAPDTWELSSFHRPTGRAQGGMELDRTTERVPFWGASGPCGLRAGLRKQSSQGCRTAGAGGKCKGQPEDQERNSCLTHHAQGLGRQ
jgi:hypothetical protein